MNIPEEYFKYKYRIHFQTTDHKGHYRDNYEPSGDLDVSFVTYQQAKNYKDEQEQIYTGSILNLSTYVISSSVTNLQGEDISGPIE